MRCCDVHQHTSQIYIYKSAKRSLLVKIDTVVSFRFVSRCECDTMWFDTSTNGPNYRYRCCPVGVRKHADCRGTQHPIQFPSRMRGARNSNIGAVWRCDFCFCCHFNVVGMRRVRWMMIRYERPTTTTRRPSNSNRTFAPETDKLSASVKNINIYDERRQKPELVFYFIISVSVARFNVFNTFAFIDCCML